MDKKKVKVYVSSTYQDLVDHRAAVKAELERAGFDVECMEKYPAFDRRPKDKCLADVAQCDCYVLIVALRYGFQPKDDNPGKLSITQLEYQEAVRLGKAPLVFLLDPDHPWPLTQADPAALAPRSRIGKFRRQLEATHGRRLFTTTDSLAAAVVGALRALEQRDGKPANDDHRQIRADYLSWLRKTCESVDLLGLDLKESQNVRLGQVYVPAVTRLQAGAENIEPAQEERHALLQQRLGEESLYLPGAPGAGKSTFCRWLALVTVNGTVPDHPIAAPDQFREQLPDSLRGRFPLLCSFRDWAGQLEGLAGNGRWYRSQLEDSLSLWLDKTRPGGLTAAVLQEELAAGRCLLILDGVDEVPETIPGGHLPRRNLITGLADALPAWLAAGHRVLLTSRPYGLSDADRRALNLPAAELAELPEPLQQTFVRRWYAAADPPRAGEKAAGLLGHLAEREDLRELRAHPCCSPPSASCTTRDSGSRRTSMRSTKPWWARCCTAAIPAPTTSSGCGCGSRRSPWACTGAPPGVASPPAPKWTARRSTAT